MIKMNIESEVGSHGLPIYTLNIANTTVKRIKRIPFDSMVQAQEVLYLIEQAYDCGLIDGIKTIVYKNLRDNYSAEEREDD